MTTNAYARIAAGVTTAYLRDVARRPAPEIESETRARRAPRRRGPARTRAEHGPGARRRTARTAA
jgi:hypothetical protein